MKITIHNEKIADDLFPYYFLDARENEKNAVFVTQEQYDRLVRSNEESSWAQEFLEELVWSMMPQSDEPKLMKEDPQ